MVTVRPWKEFCRVKTVLRPSPYLSKLYLRASLIAHSLASAPRIAEKDPRHPCGGAEPSGKGGLDRIVVQVGEICWSRAACSGDRFYPSRLTIAQGVDPDAAAEIDVFPALRVHGHGTGSVIQIDGGTGRRSASAPLLRQKHGIHLCHNSFILSDVRASQEHGTDALVGQHLNEDGMGNPAVDDVGTAHTPADCLHAAVDFRDHAAGE